MTFVLSTGMSVLFFLLFSGMELSSSPEEQGVLATAYTLTMTTFPMSSFGLFSSPAVLIEGKTNYWLTYIEHSSAPTWQHYLAKAIRVLFRFLLSIVATSLFGVIFCRVSIPLSRWFRAGALLLAPNLLFLAFGLLISQIKPQQLMTIVGDISFTDSTIIGGSWVLIGDFLDWIQRISKVTPVYHMSQLMTQLAQKRQVDEKSLVIILDYIIVITALALTIENKTEIK